mmetsp:Transcript_74263/g.195719  ORF Transcript_74263/g.195719 Transcript_74263/m.195719 type:complete len:445 (-) Transcript_74263:24-1358(-)
MQAVMRARPDAVVAAVIVEGALVSARLLPISPVVVQGSISTELFRWAVVEGEPERSEVLRSDLAQRLIACGDESEMFALSKVLGVAHGKPEDVVGRLVAASDLQVPLQEPLVEVPERLHRGPGRASLQNRRQGSCSRRRPSSLSDPQRPVLGARELLHLPACRAHGCRHCAGGAPAARSCNRALTLVRGALVEGHAGVEVWVEVPREGVATPVRRCCIRQEAVHARLVGQLVEGIPPQAHAGEHAGHRNCTKAQGIELRHDLTEVPPQVAVLPDDVHAACRNTVLELQQLQLVTDSQPHDVVRMELLQDLLRPGPGLRVLGLVAGHGRADEDLRARVAGVVHQVGPRGLPLQVGPLGGPGLEESNGGHRLLRIGPHVGDLRGAPAQRAVVQSDAFGRRARHRAQADVRRALEGRGRAKQQSEATSKVRDTHHGSVDHDNGRTRK